MDIYSISETIYYSLWKCNIMVKLNEPNELFDWKSNHIDIISGDSGDDADGSATTNESKSEVL